MNMHTRGTAMRCLSAAVLLAATMELGSELEPRAHQQGPYPLGSIKLVATEAEQYIQVLEAIERQKEKDKAFDAFEKEEAASRKITEGLIGSNRQRIEALRAAYQRQP